jgi:hypothetical protein
MDRATREVWTQRNRTANAVVTNEAPSQMVFSAEARWRLESGPTSRREACSKRCASRLSMEAFARQRVGDAAASLVEGEVRAYGEGARDKDAGRSARASDSRFAASRRAGDGAPSYRPHAQGVTRLRPGGVLARRRAPRGQLVVGLPLKSPRFGGRLRAFGERRETLVVDRREVVESGVPSAGVVEAFDVVEDGHLRLGLRAESRSIDELALEAGEEALAHCVVVRVADRAA